MLEKVCRNKVVASGLEVYNIAKEVYNLVNSNTSAQDTAEDIYLTATKSVTNKPADAITKRLDYKAVKATATKYRTLKTKINSCRNAIHNSCTKVKEQSLKGLRWCFEQLKMVYTRFKECSKQTWLYKTRGVQFFVLRLQRLRNRLATITSKFNKTNTDGIGFDELRDRSMQALKTLNAMIKNSIAYFFNTIAQNDESIKETANYSYQAARNGLKTNWQMFLDTLRNQERLLIKFFNDMEFEVYYGRGKSIKLVDTVKEYIEDITLDVREQESIILDSNGNGESINLLDVDDNDAKYNATAENLISQPSIGNILENDHQEQVGEVQQENLERKDEAQHLDVEHREEVHQEQHNAENLLHENDHFSS